MRKNRLYLFLTIICSSLALFAWNVAANRNFMALMLPQNEEPSLISCQEPGFNFSKIIHSDKAHYIFTTDFNKDGKLDVILASEPNKLDFFLGDGKGEVADFKSVSLSKVKDDFAVSMAEADFNKDGNPDYLVAKNSSGISLLLNDSLGNFVTSDITSQKAIAISIGDFNHDGKADFVSVEGNRLALFLGNGLGNFSEPSIVSSPVNIEWMSTSDLNLDGNIDIVAVGEKHLITFLGDKSGKFLPPMITDTSINGKYFQIGDFDQNGKKDLVVIDDSSPILAQILLNTGDGKFKIGEAINTTLSPSPKKINRNLVVGDYNQDGKLDFILSNGSNFDPNFDPSFARVFLGDGKGNISYGPLLGNGNARDLVNIGDFNSDGKLDLVRAVNGENNFEINLSGVAAGCLTPNFVTLPNMSLDAAPSRSTVADFNNDGKLDTITANSLSNNLSRLFGNESGGLTAQVQIPLGSEPVDLSAMDFNQDGNQDLVIANRRSNTISLLLGDGKGNFDLKTPLPLGVEPIAIKVGDFNKDGKLDIITANADKSLSVLLNDGNTFVSSLKLTTKQIPNSLEIVDLNRDGGLDIVIGNSDGADLTIFINDGAGNFIPKNVLSGCGVAPRVNGIGDFNHDGLSDLLVNCAGINRVLFGDAQLQFVDAITLTQGATSTFGDFNNDSNLDILVFVSGNNFSLLLGNGNGQIRDSINFATTVSLTNASISTGDFNQDGKLDFLVTDTNNNLVNLVINSCQGGVTKLIEGNDFQSTQVGRTFSNPLEVTVVDVVGNKLSNVTVEFEAVKLGLGAGGSFPNGENKAIVKTNAAGVAISPIFTANGFAGEYKVIATAVNDAGIRLCGISFTLTNIQGCVPPTFDQPGPNLPTATVGQPYSFAFSVSGGVPPYTYNIINGSLPPGLSLSPSGVIAGTPSGATSPFTFTVEVTDMANCTNSQVYTINLVACSPININPINSFTVLGTPYSQTLTVSGGTPPYTFSLIGGTLPPGLTLSPSGMITGTTTTSGNFNFMIQAADMLGCMGMQPFNILVCGPLQTVPPTLPNAIVGTPYSQTLTGAGGTPPYSFLGISSGTLPPGLTLSTVGMITGTPTTTGTFNFSVQIADSIGCSTAGGPGVTIIVDALVCPPISITPPILPSTFLGTPYNQTLTANGGTAPYTFSIATGTLPPGLTLSQTGMITGTSTTSGSFNFTVQVMDNAGCIGIQTYMITVCQPIGITPTTFPNGTVGTPYNQTLGAIGGTPPHIFFVASGVLPPGLTLNQNGDLTGTPTAPGTFSFQLGVNDSFGCGSITPRSITINPLCSPISITPPTLPDAPLGIPYNQVLGAIGGTAPYTFAIASGSLAPGLTLNPSGTITGTPTTTGNFSFFLVATDINGCVGTQNYSLIVACPTITGTPPALPSATLGVMYNQQLGAIGGTAPYTFAVASGPLAPGLTLSQSGLLAGVPASTGSFGFSIQITDANGCNGFQPYALTVSTCPSITFTPPVLNAGTVGFAYSDMLGATGGVAPYTFSITSGSLPPGLLLTPNGAISGTPSASGVFLFGVQVVDNIGCSSSRMYAIGIACSTISLSPSFFPSSPLGVPYPSVTLSASGGTPPYNFSVINGALPPGLTLNRGSISGTPTSAGLFTFDIAATDVSGCVGMRTYSIFIITPCVLTFAPTTLPNAAMGTPYNQVITINGGNQGASYFFNISNGSLPPGLSLQSNGTAASILGTPLLPGTFNFTLSANENTEGQGCSGSQNYTIIVSSTCATISINPNILPDASINLMYSQALTASGGTSPYTFSLVSGSLPDGLTINQAGVISGVPTTGGAFNFVVQAKDSNNCASSKNYSLTVGGAPGTVGLSASSFTITEGGRLTVTVTRTSGSAGQVAVNYATVNGSAASGREFAPASGTITFADGDMSPKTFTIQTNANTTVEANKTFTVQLSNPTGGAELGTASATVTIMEKDVAQPGSLAFTQPAFTAFESSGSVNISVVRLNGGNIPVTIDYATSAGSNAVPGVNYVETRGRLTFMPGAGNTQSFIIPILNDNQPGSDKIVNIRLSNPTGGATVSGGFTTLTIKEISNNPAQLKVDLQDIDFGSVNIGNISKRTVTVTNNGGQELNFTPIVNGNGVKILGSPSTRLLANQSTNFDILYEALPGSLGNLIGLLNLTSNGGDASIKLIGKSIDITPPKMTFNSPSGGDLFGSGTQVKIRFDVVENDALSNSIVSFVAVLPDGKILGGDIARLDGQSREATWNIPIDLESGSVKIFLKSSDRATNISTLPSGQFSVRRSSATAPILETLVTFVPPPTGTTAAPSGLKVDAKESAETRNTIPPQPVLSVQIGFQAPPTGQVAPPQNVTVRAKELTDKGFAKIAKIDFGISPKADGDVVIAGYNVYRVPQKEDGTTPTPAEIVKEENLVTTLPPNSTGFTDNVSTTGANNNFFYSVSTFFGNGQMSSGSQPMGTNLPVIKNPTFTQGTVFLDIAGSFIKQGATLTINERETYPLQFDETGTRFTVSKKQASSGTGIVIKRLIGKTSVVSMTVKNPDGATSVIVKFSRKGIVTTAANNVNAENAINPLADAPPVAGFNVYRVAQPLDGSMPKIEEIVKPENLVGSIPAGMTSFMDKASTGNSPSGNFVYSVSTFFGNGQMSSGSQPAGTDLPVIKNPQFIDKGFFVDIAGSFIKMGATLMINDAETYPLEFDDTGTRFTTRKGGSTSGQTIDKFIKKGDSVRLNIKNPDGKLSVGVIFERKK